MSRRPLRSGIGAAVAAALVFTPLIPAASAAAPAVVLASDFEADTAPWAGRGDAQLALADDARSGAHALAVTGRSAGWHGPQVAAADVFTAGTVAYTVSAWVKLIDGQATAEMNLGVQQPNATDAPDWNEYPWVGGRVSVTDADWVELTGTFTPSAANPPTALYLESASADVQFLVDDVVVTAAGAPDDSDVAPGGAVDPTTTPVTRASGSGDVSALTFDDGPNGETTAKLLDYLRDNDLPAVFCVIGQNIQAPGGAELVRRMVAEGHTLCNHTTGYDDMGSWTAADIRANLEENLRIIRTALGDPAAAVPYFRAPNGSWGATPGVAVELGMQPLGVVNTINDWSATDPAVLTENLRAAMKPGELVLVHDGGGDREPSLQAVTTVVDERLAAGWKFTLPAGAPTAPPTGTLLQADFEDGDLAGWTPRAGSDTSAPTVAVVPGGAAGTGFAAQVSDRTHEGDGMQFDVTGVLQPGSTYSFDAQMRFADGAEVGQGLSVSMRTVNGADTTYTNLIQAESLTASGWTGVSGQFTVPAYDTAAELYVEARYNSGNTSPFLVDEITLTAPQAGGPDTSLTPMKDTVDFPLGVAIDSRETTGQAADLLRHHFEQITPENHMKVEAWYDADQNFARHPEATALLDFAAANDQRLYSHVLLWHSQTPDWFFQQDGRDLTASEADKQVLRDRLSTHIDDVARSIADDYGLFGSATNPVVGWDVVNEVVADQQTADGLRTSRWYEVLGEEYIRLAFELAEEAFNETYAAPGTDRPVKLFINDYNTEQDRKGAQYHALVQRLLDAGTPIDGVGHQFHVSLNTTIASMEAALARFSGMGLLQEVTELDVTVNPPTEANLVRQGYFYRDAFQLFRDYHRAAPAAEKLFAVTIWGLTDNRSWRSEQVPLVFDANLQAKPAYFGAVGDEQGLPDLVTTANVFGGDVALADGFEDAPEWRNLPENQFTVGDGGFQARWNDTHLAVLVRSTVAPERVEFTYGGEDLVYTPGATSGVSGRTVEVNGIHHTVVHLPHTGIATNSTAAFDVRVVSGGTVAGAWNSPGATGQLTFLDPLSFLQVPELPAPAMDGRIDDVWQRAAVAVTAKTVEGSADGATAEVRTLWQGDSLYALFEVTDPVRDATNSDPWNRDGVELFLDLGNSKSGTYGPNDTQIRITADGATLDERLSFGTGNAAAQRARVVGSATTATETGYIVEVEIALTGQSGGQNDVPLGGLGTFHGIDFQVNDGRAGARHAVHTWAEPDGVGYQSTGRWGVAELVAAPTDPGTDPTDPGTDPTDPGTDPTDPTDPGTDPGDGGDWATVEVPSTVEQGETLPVTVSGLEPGQRISATLFSDPLVASGIPAADAQGRISFAMAIPRDFAVGPHTLVIESGALEPISVDIQVRAARVGNTGGEVPWGIALAAAFALVAGGLFTALRPRRRGAEG
ncbi:endo-1,4-beta-xylanase [Microbacterium sp. zg.Y909]|uniref:endo-1,4-beta-xylanase n=1 Tax=Microbacterium sp. zg.Y909 TaxID=2969413 RepID=UPI00214AC589|nr:endo-1,4-beta-xylanase [Microbacterium sp. zg.Y909]MCR2824847.1 endo-1,4-beta-xylanase [Microbacterium sp. zg.Y909]